jgi:hypothetical protein
LDVLHDIQLRSKEGERLERTLMLNWSNLVIHRNQVLPTSGGIIMIDSTHDTCVHDDGKGRLSLRFTP